MNQRLAKLLTFFIPNKYNRRVIRKYLEGNSNIIPRTESNVIPLNLLRNEYGRRKVAILTNKLLDWETLEPCFGGGERYALNIATLLKQFGFEVHFYQMGKTNTTGEYYGFPVTIIPLQKDYSEFSYQVGNIFYELSKNYDHIYYNTPELCSGKMRNDAIMTCHGIWFDHENYPGTKFRSAKWFNHLYKVFAQPKKIVSVDTNSINTIRTFYPDLTDNMTYIPNFVDKNIFKPDFSKRNEERLRILFPRRSQINRGSRILGDILENIPYQDIEIYWVGEGDAQDTEIIKKLSQKDKRLHYYSVSFEEMPQWYQKCDITVIPTIACEGTSLSAIEALACGSALVVTNIGGLSNIILDGYNGILCESKAKNIAKAINDLIENPKLRLKYQQNALYSSNCFSLDNWKRKWVEVLLEEDWISGEQAFEQGYIKQNEIKKYRKNRIAILTRNAIHGGVESLIKQEAKYLNADVIVCGGADCKETTPFKYTRADDRLTLLHKLSDYKAILYHWVPDYALDVIEECKIPCVEFVHRDDVNNCNRPVADAYVTHSKFLVEYVKNNTHKDCIVVPHPIDTTKFVPATTKGNYIGGVTTYWIGKGIDVFIKAWAKVKNKFPTIKARFYGQGNDLELFKKLSDKYNADVEFLPPTTTVNEVLKDYQCIVSPSRIEGMPVAILEALSMNIPVIASSLSGMVEFNKTGEDKGFKNLIYLTESGNVDALANMIDNVLTQKSERISREYIEKNFNPKTHCEIIQKVFLDIENKYSK